MHWVGTGVIRPEAADRALAERAVKEWNALMERGAARHRPGWSPTIGVAIAAGFPFLDALCPGCHQFKQVDLRQLKRHERTSLHGLIPLLSCRNCRPHPPFAKLVKLSPDWQSASRPPSVAKRGL